MFRKGTLVPRCSICSFRKYPSMAHYHKYKLSMYNHLESSQNSLIRTDRRDDNLEREKRSRVDNYGVGFVYKMVFHHYLSYNKCNFRRCPCEGNIGH